MNLYFGFAVQFGGILIAGAQAIEGRLYSASDFNDQFDINCAIYTAGVGVGASANLNCIMAYGGKCKEDFVGVRIGGWDFAADLGERWGDLAKAARFGKAAQRIKAFYRPGRRTLAGLRQLCRLSPDEWGQFSTLAKELYETLDLDAAKPGVYSLEVPFAGAGLELSIYRYWGSVVSIH